MIGVIASFAIVGGIMGGLWWVFFRVKKPEQPRATLNSGGPGTTPPPPEADR